MSTRCILAGEEAFVQYLEYHGGAVRDPAAAGDG